MLRTVSNVYTSVNLNVAHWAWKEASGYERSSILVEYEKPSSSIYRSIFIVTSCLLIDFNILGEIQIIKRTKRLAAINFVMSYSQTFLPTASMLGSTIVTKYWV